MLTILADFTCEGAYVALVYDTDSGFGVVAKGHTLWFGKSRDETKGPRDPNYTMAREVYDLSCVDAGATTFRNHEAPTC